MSRGRGAMLAIAHVARCGHPRCLEASKRLIPSPPLFRLNSLVLSVMGVVVIPRVIFRLTPLAARQAVAPCWGYLRWSTALLPRSLVDGIRLPADGATSSRLRHAPQATAPVCTRLLPQSSPVGFIRRMQMTTTRPSQDLVSSGLVALALPPSPSRKFLRQFHQTNRVNGITLRVPCA